MTEIAMRREGSHLVPVDEVAAESAREIPDKRDVLVKVTTPRNIRQFRLAWALAQKISEAVDFLQDREDSMSWLKIKARHVKMLQNPVTGQVAIIPRSIAFASLSQDAFNRLFRRMVSVTCTEIIPGLEEGALRAELEQMVGIEPPTAPLAHLAGAGKGFSDYVAYAKHWIDTTTDDQAHAQGRWDNEYETRQELMLPASATAQLQARLDKRYAK